MPDAIKVLIVEDRRDDAEIMVLALEADNFDVAWTRVETSEDYLRHLSPDVDVVLATTRFLNSMPPLHLESSRTPAWIFLSSL
jgi:hypothetical protein